MNYKLTVDVNLILGPKVSGMDALLRWKEEGKVELLEADPPRVPKPADYNWPGAAPKAPGENRYQRSNMRGRMKKETAGGPDFKGVAAVLFPNKDPQKLNMSEINNVAHLIRHHTNKNELFVTGNPKDFIEGGRRESLKAQFGIITMTPEEAVKMLSEIEGWK